MDIITELHRKAAALAVDAERLRDLLASAGDDLDATPDEAARMLLRLGKLAHRVEDMADAVSAASPSARTAPAARPAGPDRQTSAPTSLRPVSGRRML